MALAEEIVLIGPQLLPLELRASGAPIQTSSRRCPAAVESLMCDADHSQLRFVAECVVLKAIPDGDSHLGAAPSDIQSTRSRSVRGLAQSACDCGRSFTRPQSRPNPVLQASCAAAPPVTELPSCRGGAASGSTNVRPRAPLPILDLSPSGGQAMRQPTKFTAPRPSAVRLPNARAA